MDANHVTGPHGGNVVLAVSLELSAAQWKVALQREAGGPHGQRVAGEPATAGRSRTHRARQAEVVPAVERARGCQLRSGAGRILDRSCAVLPRHRELYDRCREHPCGAPQAACEDRQAGCHQAGHHLRAWLHGERDRMHVVRVPSVDDKAVRHLIRDGGQLHKEVLQHRERMRKLLVTMGCWDDVDHRSFARLLSRGELVCRDGTPLPEELRERLVRETARLELAEQQLAALERALEERLSTPVRERITHLRRLRGVGHIGASRLMLELFWRQFNNPHHRSQGKDYGMRSSMSRKGNCWDALCNASRTDGRSSRSVELLQSRPSSLDVELPQPDAIRTGLVRRPEPTGAIISAQLRHPKFAGNVNPQLRVIRLAAPRMASITSRCSSSGLKCFE